MKPLISQPHQLPVHINATSIIVLAAVVAFTIYKYHLAMGNLCGKPSKDDPFSQPGRTVGSAPAPQSRSSVPKISSQAQGQTLGGPNLGDRDEARRAAAKAAEVSGAGRHEELR